MRKKIMGRDRSTPGNNRSRFEHISNDRVLDSRLNFSGKKGEEGEEGRKKMKKREKGTEASSA